MNKYILFLILAAVLELKALAGSDFQSIYQSPNPWNFSIYSEKTVSISSEARQKSIETLMLLRAHPFFKDRLPPWFSVLASSSWTGAQGFWSNDLKDIFGNPAVLIRADALDSPEDLARLLIHEFSHYIHFQANPQDPPWQQEGFALLMEYIVTGSLNPVFQSGFSTPETSLIQVVNPHLDSESIQVTSLRAAQYGHILQYFYYLYRNCGQLDFLMEFLVPTNKNAQGKNSLERIFEKNKNDKVCGSLDGSFFAFSAARFSPNLVNPRQYVHFSSIKARVHESRGGVPQKLPPYSSSAYIKRPGTSCIAGSSELNSRTCLIVKMSVK